MEAEWNSEVEINVTEYNKEKREKKPEQTLRDFWDNIKCTDIHIIGFPREEREEKQDKIFEIWRDYSWKFPIIVKETLKSRMHREYQIG